MTKSVAWRNWVQTKCCRPIFFYYLAYSFIENVVVINVLRRNKPLWKRSVFYCIGYALQRLKAFFFVCFLNFIHTWQSPIFSAFCSECCLMKLTHIQIITHIKYDFFFLNDIFFSFVILHVHLCTQYNKIFWGPWQFWENGKKCWRLQTSLWNKVYLSILHFESTILKRTFCNNVKVSLIEVHFKALCFNILSYFKELG